MGELKEGYGLCPLMTTVVISHTGLTHGPVGACLLSSACVCKSTCRVTYMNRGCILMFPSCYVWVYGNKPKSFHLASLESNPRLQKRTTPPPQGAPIHSRVIKSLSSQTLEVPFVLCHGLYVTIFAFACINC